MTGIQMWHLLPGTKCSLRYIVLFTVLQWLFFSCHVTQPQKKMEYCGNLNTRLVSYSDHTSRSQCPINISPLQIIENHCKNFKINSYIFIHFRLMWCKASNNNKMIILEREKLDKTSFCIIFLLLMLTHLARANQCKYEL